MSKIIEITKEKNLITEEVLKKNILNNLEDVNLYLYQLSSIIKMEDYENNNFDILKYIDKNELYNMYNEGMPSENTDITVEIKNLRYGVLANKVGSGKTYIICGLIKRNISKLYINNTINIQKTTHKHTQNYMVNVKLIDSSIKKLKINESMMLYYNDHINFKETICISLNEINTQPNTIKYFNITKNVIYLDTNIIIVPNNLIQHWETVLSLYKLKFITVNKKNIFLKNKDYVLNMFNNAYDVILVSCNFFNIINDIIITDKSTKNINNYLANIPTYSRSSIEYYSIPKKYSLGFNRVIIDEYDSIKSRKRIIEKFCNYKFLWGITATPQNIRRAHKGVVANELDELDEEYTQIENRDTVKINPYVIKCSENYIEEEVNLNKFKINNYIYKCKLDKILNIIKKSGFINTINKENLLNADNIMDLAESLGIKIKNEDDFLLKLKEKYEKKIIELKKLVGFEKHNLTVFIETFNRDENHPTVIRLKLKIEKLEADLKESTVLYNRYNEILLNYKELDCLICLDKLEKPTILKCCKCINCLKCIYTWLQTKNTCVNCRARITDDDLTILDNIEEKKEIVKPKEEKKEIVSKVDKVIEIIKNSKAEQSFIVYISHDSKFHEILKKLDGENIKAECIRGQASFINKNILKYKNKEIKVLLLTIAFNAAGLNLETTTDIILYHKVSEFTEKQIVGRAIRINRKKKLALNIHRLKYENE